MIVEYESNTGWIKTYSSISFLYIKNAYITQNPLAIRTKYRINKIIFIIFHK